MDGRDFDGRWPGLIAGVGHVLRIAMMLREAASEKCFLFVFFVFRCFCVWLSGGLFFVLFCFGRDRGRRSNLSAGATEVGSRKGWWPGSGFLAAREFVRGSGSLIW
jgi:hypothetical protein